MTDEHRATREATVKMWKKGLSCWRGRPESWFEPPGMAVEVVKATVATRAATTEQDSAVFVSHLLPSFMRRA